MSRTVNVNEEFVVVSEGKKDTGKFAVLGDGGKFDTSVIPVIDELQEQITKEVTERTEGDKALQTNIDTETSARISADQQLQGNIEAEATARDAADKDLEDKLAAEVTARTNGDTQLQANLEAEANTRSVADKDLQDQISKEITARTDGYTALQSSVDKEVVARTDADNKLQSSIDNEVDARAKADQSLQDQVTAEIATRTNADETEANTRVSADKELQNKIDTLEGKNAFSNVVVNGTNIKATSQEDTIELEAGTNIALTADTASEKVTIAITGKVASAAQADNASTADIATKLATARSINGVPFDGSADITISTGIVPIGSIVMWSGSTDTIPTDWALCNGSNGTPNLLDRMVVCAGESYTVGDTGGEASHTLAIDEIPSHYHDFPGDDHYLNAFQSSSSGFSRVEAIGNWDWSSGAASGNPNGWYNPGSKGCTGGSAAHNNMPPYYALAYIMRIA